MGNPNCNMLLWRYWSSQVGIVFYFMDKLSIAVSNEYVMFGFV